MLVMVVFFIVFIWIHLSTLLIRLFLFLLIFLFMFFLTFILMDISVNPANQVFSFVSYIAFDAHPKFFACLVRFESSSVPTTLPTAYDVYPLDGRHDGGYYTVKDCVTIDVLPRTPGN